MGWYFVINNWFACVTTRLQAFLRVIEVWHHTVSVLWRNVETEWRLTSILKATVLINISKMTLPVLLGWFLTCLCPLVRSCLQCDQVILYVHEDFLSTVKGIRVRDQIELKKIIDHAYTNYRATSRLSSGVIGKSDKYCCNGSINHYGSLHFSRSLTLISSVSEHRFVYVWITWMKRFFYISVDICRH